MATYPYGKWYYVTTTDATQINMTGFNNIQSVTIPETIPVVYGTSKVVLTIPGIQYTSQSGTGSYQIGDVAFDEDSDYFGSNGTYLGNWIKVILPDSYRHFIPTYYQSVPFRSSDGCDAIRVEGSNDDISWDKLGDWSGFSNDAVGGFSLNASKSYKYIRISGFTDATYNTPAPRLGGRWIKIFTNNPVIRYLVSFDGRQTWKKWDSASQSWIAVDLTQGGNWNWNTQSVMQSQLVASWKPSFGSTIDFLISMFSYEDQTTPTVGDITVVGRK
jgi:hypothetical protein